MQWTHSNEFTQFHSKKNLRFASTSSIKRKTRKFHIEIEIVQWQ